MDPEEIKKARQEQEEANSASQENLRITRDINNEIRNRIGLLKGEQDLRSSTLKALRDANKLAEQAVDFQEEGKKVLLDSQKLQKAASAQIQNIAKLRKNADDLQIQRMRAQRDLQADRSKMSKEEIAAAEDQIKAAQSATEAIRDQVEQQKVGLETTRSLRDVSEQISMLPASKAFGFLKDIANAIPGLGKLTKGFDKAAEASKEAAANMVKIDKETGKASTLNIFERSAAGLKGLAAGVGSLMDSFGPIAIIAKLFEGMMKADKSAGDMAKSLNMTYKESQGLSSELLKVSQSSSSLGVNYDGLKHAIVDINASLGTTGNINMETLKSFSKMQKLAGMTSEEIMGITQLSLAAGGNLEEMTGQFMEQARLTSTNLGIALNEKELLKDISNISAATTLSLGKNPQALANAVATAKSLGFEMSNLEGIANSLLNFESSIEDEMQAELLLGKQLNLDKARQAALNNDIAGLAAAVKEEIGSSADFAKMNRLQQEALAKAVGMSREELAKTLFVEEQMAGATGDEAQKRREIFDKLVEEKGLTEARRTLQEEGFEGLEAQVSKQEEAALAAEKLNENFMTAGKNLLPIVDTFTKMLTLVQQNLHIVLAIGAASKVIGATMKANAAIQTIINAKEKGFLAKRLASLGITAGRSAAAIPIIGFGLAAAAGIAAFALGKSLISKSESAVPSDDLMLPGGAGSGYGDRMISAPEGTFALNNKDTIIAGTNLDQGGANMSNAELVKLQAQTNNLLTRLLNKNASIKMDSEELGTAISLNNYEISA